MLLLMYGVNCYYKWYMIYNLERTIKNARRKSYDGGHREVHVNIMTMIGHGVYKTALPKSKIVNPIGMTNTETSRSAIARDIRK